MFTASAKSTTSGLAFGLVFSSALVLLATVGLQPSAAQEAYEDVPAWNSIGLQARFELARTLLEQGEYPAASHELEILLVQGGDPFSVHAMLSTSYLLAGDIPRAKAHLAAAHALDPDNLDVLALRGQYELTMGDPLVGESLLESLVARQPGIFEAHLLLARQYLQREATQEAAPHLETLAKLAQGQAATLVKAMQARFYALQGEHDLAMQCAGEAYAEEPSMPEAMREWGLALAQVGRYSEAKPLLVRSWKQGPQDPHLAYALGEMAFRSNDWEAALGYWRQGHAMNALAYPMAMKWLGLTLATGGIAAAEDKVSELQKTYPHHAAVSLIAAYWARKRGRYAEAARLLERLSRLPISAEMHHDVVWEKAQLEFEAGRHKNSMKLVKGLIERGVWVKEATLLQARLAFYRSDWQEGERLQGLAKQLPAQWPKAGTLATKPSKPTPAKVAGRNAP